MDVGSLGSLGVPQPANRTEVLVANLSYSFNLLIHKGCSENIDQIARQIVYTLRWADKPRTKSHWGTMSEVVKSRCVLLGLVTLDHRLIGIQGAVR